MAVEFRCEKCGKLLSADAEPGSMMKCPHCQKKVAVPAGLASLPQPHLPPGQEPPPPPPPPPPGGEGQVAEGEEEEPIEEDSAVMGAMAYVMPWVISVFFHVGLVLIFMFVTMFVLVKHIPEDVIVPDATLSANPGGVVNPGRSDPNVQQTQNRVRTTSDGDSNKDTDIPADSGKTDKQVTLIGTSAGGSGGSLAPWGHTTGGSGRGPRSNFFGSGGNAHHIVYVIDRSGSMVEVFDIVRTEMLISISRLSPKQDFHVIMFSKGPPIEAAARRLAVASRMNKEAAAAFLETVRAQGETDPIPALERAFNVLAQADRRRPGRLIYLLTDGNFPDNAAVLAAIRKINTDKKVYINTYLYGRRPPEAEKVMRAIAKENNGRYKYVSSDE